MTIEDMKHKLKTLISKERYIHSLGVMDTIYELAKIHGADCEKALIAGLLHDCAKNIDVSEMFELCLAHGIPLDSVAMTETGLIHAFLGVVIARRDFRVFDVEILAAIYYHTIGGEDMTLLMKLLYISDMIEPGRKFENLDELREIAKHDVDVALIRAFNISISHVLRKGRQLHPQTVLARNFLLKTRCLL